MAQAIQTSTGQPLSLPEGLQGIVADWSSDQRAFKNVPWGKAMMWIFLLSDTFIFSCFLISYMTVRMSTTEPWPNPSEVFGLELFGKSIPLLLIAIMTFVLISSSGTMAMAVKFGYEKNRKMTFILLLCTAALGATFVGMQAFEWTKLILHEGIRPWGNPLGAAQFGSVFFMITGFHGTHVSIGVIFLLIVATKVIRGDLDHERPGFMTGRKGKYEIVEIMGLYWHFVDLVWVFIFAVFYLWLGKMAAHVEGQQHPIGIYLKIWGLLFVLSTASYLVDYFHFQGYLRWFLIILFMLLKAGLIVAVFMHMLWERLALMYAILAPTLLLMVLLGIGALEADYTFFTRGVFFLKGLF